MPQQTVDGKCPRGVEDAAPYNIAVGADSISARKQHPVYFTSPSTASITRSQSSKLKLVEQGRLTIYLR